jgi:hypothetical protein
VASRPENTAGSTAPARVVAAVGGNTDQMIALHGTLGAFAARAVA